MILLPAPLRLRLDKAALVSNWNWLNQRSGNAACGAAIKENGYGTDAPGVMRQLAAAGCRDFFVANWAEAMALSPLADGISLTVLNGVRAGDMAVASKGRVRHRVNTATTIQRGEGTRIGY